MTLSNALRLLPFLNNFDFLMRAYAKINLALDILNKDSSGYHQIHMVMHEPAMPFDEVHIDFTEGNEISIDCDHPDVPRDETNTVYRAAALFKEEFGITTGLKISIQKGIPVSAGLGGGSSDAVATLKLLAEKFGVNCCSRDTENSRSTIRHLPSCKLYSLCRKIGMDCAFFLNGGTAEATHFGEELNPLPELPASLHIEVIDTGVQISSKWAYENLSMIQCAVNEEKTALLIRALYRGDAHEILENLHNDFESLVYEKFPVLLAKKYDLESRKKNSKVLLAGSGGALIWIWPSDSL